MIKKIIPLCTLAIAGCMTPHGYIDLAFIPQRCDDKIKLNQTKIEINIDLENKINRDLSINIGGTTRTYSDFTDSIFFNPERQEYEMYLKLRKDNIEFYVSHECSHPVKDTEEWIYDSRKNEQAYINHDSKTEIGVKYRW